MIKVAIAGAAGRMGQAIIREMERLDDMMLVAALVSERSRLVGKDAGEMAGVRALSVPASSGAIEGAFDVMVDFSRPDALRENLEICKRQGAGIVVGTTGLNDSQNQSMAEAAKQIPVLYAANTSIGINLCVSLVEMAARVLGEASDIEIIEAHHRHKVDAPSGTAILLGEAAAMARDQDLVSCGIFSREGYTGERPTGSIGFSTIRGGDIAGEHTVMFIGESERIEITHRTTDRKIFARGALKAAGWLSGQESGLYTMRDALNLD